MEDSTVSAQSLPDTGTSTPNGGELSASIPGEWGVAVHPRGHALTSSKCHPHLWYQWPWIMANPPTAQGPQGIYGHACLQRGEWRGEWFSYSAGSSHHTLATHNGARQTGPLW